MNLYINKYIYKSREINLQLKKYKFCLYRKCFYIFHYILMRQEFMDFVAQNNVIGVAIWLLIATKVWELTKSLIEDFVTPLIFSPILKKLKIEKLEDLSWRWVLYGKLLARGIDFIIVALVVFIVIKALWVEM